MEKDGSVGKKVLDMDSKHSLQPSPKKNFFQGEASSRSNSAKQSQMLYGFKGFRFEVPSMDSDKGSGDEKANSNSKGKGVLSSFADNSYGGKDKSSFLENHKSSDLESIHDDLYNDDDDDDDDMEVYYENLIYDEDYALQAHLDSRDIPPGEEAPIPWFLAPPQPEKPQSPENPDTYNSIPYTYGGFTTSNNTNTLPSPPVPPMSTMQMRPPTSSMGTHMYSWLDNLCVSGQSSPHDIGSSSNSAIPAGSSSVPFLTVTNGNEKDILEKFQSFKQFDTIEDFSDHLFQDHASAVKHVPVPPKKWAKKIQEEWKILEKNLPDTIQVRVYESRMELVRAVIVGAAGTPYHDGLFFFDIILPRNYPYVPPHVQYHSHGLEINPNIRSNGEVCLSLLNTWSGDQNEKWIPGVSTILQLLVSIQALILNGNPYFNGPGFELSDGSPSREFESQQFNERVFALSLRTMVYTIRKPPKHFEDYVIGHFFKRAQDIVDACKAYFEGAKVGCLVSGGDQNFDASFKGCSPEFPSILANYIPTLVETFSYIGVKDLEGFLSLADKTSFTSPPPLPFHYH